MSINDYYYSAVHATHTGFNVSLARVNNVDKPDIIYLISSVSSSILSNKSIAEELDNAIETIDQPSDYMKKEKLVIVLTNENKNLQMALFSHFERNKHIQSYSSKDVSQSLYGLAEKIGSGQLMVKSSIAKDIQIDLQQTTDTDISARIQSLILISDTSGKGWFRSLGLPVQRGMYLRI